MNAWCSTFNWWIQVSVFFLQVTCTVHPLLSKCQALMKALNGEFTDANETVHHAETVVQ